MTKKKLEITIKLKRKTYNKEIKKLMPILAFYIKKFKVLYIKMKGVVI